MSTSSLKFDVFLSYSHDDADWVEALAKKLQDQLSFEVWLDRWLLIPGQSWQREIARALNETATCAVCVSNHTPDGWFRQEIELVLNHQAQSERFRVIPVLLPDANPECLPEFLPLRTWADFRHGQDEKYAFHVLVQGIRGQPIGRWPPTTSITKNDEDIYFYVKKAIELQKFKNLGFNKEVIVEFEHKILSMWFEERR
jgi:hypothetical protein